MQRRHFIGLLSGTAAIWPNFTRGQQLGPMRRIGILMNLAAEDALGQTRKAALLQALQALGWNEERNLRVDVRWGAGDSSRYRRLASELVALAPDLIFAASGSTMPALMQATQSIPIVFVLVPDPVGSGFVASLAKPGGNATGFTQFEFGVSGKWLEVLREIAPRTTRAGILRDPADPAGIGQFGALQSTASSLRMEVHPIDVRNATSIEQGIAALAKSENGGLVVTGSTPAGRYRKLIIALAARHRLPAVYAYRYFTTDGGLASYGPDTIDPYKRAAAYVDRILRGEKPADLPVQAPTKYELAINLKTAKAMGLSVPQSLLARADQIIE